MKNSQPLGVFDSGIGGLTVVRALTRHLPHENIIYFGDTARVPYGPKSPQVVREYALQDTDVLLRHDVKLIVIACNTVSAVALDVVQKRANIPVVGVILPGADAAVRATTNKRIGIIGTVGTIFSNAYTNAIRQINSGLKVFGQPCPLFVPLAEEGWIDHKATELIAKEYLFPLTLEKIDTLVLGCTHYPLLRDVIGKVLRESVTLIDSGEATAIVVKNMLAELQLTNPSSLKPNLQFYVSDLPHKFTEIGERFLGTNLGKVQRVSSFLS
jgi:glutamate racemase